MMRRIFGFILAISTALALSGCGGGVKSSGVPEVDQSAIFVKELIDTLREEERFDKASEIATFITSAEGRIEFMPPHSTQSPDEYLAYTGHKPHERVAIWQRPFSIGKFSHYLLIAGDDERDRIVVSAFNVGETEPFYIWKF